MRLAGRERKAKGEDGYKGRTLDLRMPKYLKEKQAREPFLASLVDSNSLLSSKRDFIVTNRNTYIKQNNLVSVYAISSAKKNTLGQNHSS